MLVKITETTHPSPLSAATENAPKIQSTPYIKDLSEIIEKVCAPLEVKPVLIKINEDLERRTDASDRTPEWEQT